VSGSSKTEGWVAMALGSYLDRLLNQNFNDTLSLTVARGAGISRSETPMESFRSPSQSSDCKDSSLCSTTFFRNTVVMIAAKQDDSATQIVLIRRISNTRKWALYSSQQPIDQR